MDTKPDRLETSDRGLYPCLPPPRLPTAVHTRQSSHVPPLPVHLPLRPNDDSTAAITQDAKPQSNRASRSSSLATFAAHDYSTRSSIVFPQAQQDPVDGLNLPARPTPGFKHISSFDNLLAYYEQKAEWKSAASSLYLESSRSCESGAASVLTLPPKDCSRAGECDKSKFRHSSAEIGFCFTVAMTQFLAEYLISGFAVVLPNLFSKSDTAGSGMTGAFWPAALLSLILSASLLIFARISDMYGGYLPFMLGLLWLIIWTLLPGLDSSLILLNVSRAMQGLAIAAFMPSTFTMIGAFYTNGPRKNVILGCYGACAPLGFYAGFLVGGALPADESSWYFWIAAILASITVVTAYFSVPHDRTNRKELGLKMDWPGAFFIMSGLILVAYALAVEPYVSEVDGTRIGFTYPTVLAPLLTGLVCLGVAVWIEGYYAACPLLSFGFFRPRGIAAFCMACLFFYGTFGVWIYNSSEFFRAPMVTGETSSISDLLLALWYTPTAVGGVLFCIVGGSVADIIPMKVLIIISGLAWVGAPLVFAVGPTPLSYWSEVLPSMICATLGVDLTFTISNVFLSSSQPQEFQGVAGAVSSILVNLGMSFSLPISEIVNQAVVKRHEDTMTRAEAVILGYRATFYYAVASAAAGLIICVLFLRLSYRCSATPLKDVEKRRSASSSASTLADQQ